MRAWIAGLALIGMVGGCGGAGGGDDTSNLRPDAGPPDAGCRNNDDCEPGWACKFGQCIEACPGMPEGLPCNLGEVNPTFPVCCAPDEQCCSAGFEREDCFSAGQPCPVGCHNFFYVCPADWFCQPDSVPSVDACADSIQCVETCAPERRCGERECCSEGSRCDSSRGCCVGEAPIDAGAPDAATVNP